MDAFGIAGIAVGSIGFCICGAYLGIMLRELVRSSQEPAWPQPQYMPLQAVPVPIGPQGALGSVPGATAPPSPMDSSDPLRSEFPVRV